MPEGGGITRVSLREARKRLGLIRAVATLVIVVLLAVVAVYHFEPLSVVLHFIPKGSISVVVGIALGLSLVGGYLFWMLSRRLLRELQYSSSMVEKLLALTRDIREELYGDILLEKIAEASMSLTGSEASSVLLREDGQLRYKVVKGPKSQELQGKAAHQTGVAAWVLRHKQPLLINDTASEERFNPSMDAEISYRTRRILCSPMFTREGPVGAIQVLNKPTPYTEFDQELLSYLAGHAAVSLERARFHEDQRNFQIHITDILLDAIDRFIPEKRGHSRRVAQYANMLAKALGLQEAERRRLYFASLLHDIGFMRIPLEEHFQKSQYMKHPVIGYEMLSPISFYKDIATVVLHHHERYDGYGYPQGLKGEQIPLQSRIIHIAEAFDSMVSRVSYKIAVSFDVAMEELLRHAGSQFDPALVGRFREVVEKPLE